MPSRVRTVEDVVRALRRAHAQYSESKCGAAVFLIGAGCSRSAGIPTAVSIAGDIACHLAKVYVDRECTDPDEALQTLKDHGHVPIDVGWQSAYGYLFEHHLPDAVEQKMMIKRALAKGAGHTNWAHICLGELVASHYVHTVLTTNFDQLVLDGIVRAGILPVVADGIEALCRIDGRPETPQVVHLHGSLHTYNTRNAASAVKDTADAAPFVGSLREVLRVSQVLVVAGYSGGEDGVMETTIRAARELGDKTIFWIQLDPDPSTLSPSAIELLRFSKSGGVVPGQDADAFFRKVTGSLNVGLPRWMSSPTAFLQRRAREISEVPNPDIADQLNSYRTQLRTLADCWQRHLDDREAVTHALDEARELRVAGKFEEAFGKLNALAQAIADPRLFAAAGSTGVELGLRRVDSAILHSAVEWCDRALRASHGLSGADELTIRSAIGRALRELGERDTSYDGLVRAIDELQKAVILARAAGLDTAAVLAQEELARALQVLGYRQWDPNLLDRALQEQRAVAAGRSRAADPPGWARSQKVLADVLVRVSQIGGPARADALKEAIGSYEAALQILRREHYPDTWAATKVNLAMALRTLGTHTSDPAPLRRAEIELKDALTVPATERPPGSWAATMHNLGAVHLSLWDVTREVAELRNAIGCLRTALDQFQGANDAWKQQVSSNLSRALIDLAEVTDEIGLASEALEICTSLGDLAANGLGALAPQGLRNHGRALLLLAKAGRRDLYSDAIAKLQAAASGFEAIGRPERAAEIRQELSDLAIPEGP